MQKNPSLFLALWFLTLCLTSNSFASSSTAFEVQTTSTGHVFTKVTEEELITLGIKDTKKFGEAWKDESGTIWGDIRKDRPPGTGDSQPSAWTYCEELGAKLPTILDFCRLRSYMGGSKKYCYSGQYTPQVLPNLTYLEGAKTLGHWFWSSDRMSSDPKSGWSDVGRLFIGDTGKTDFELFYWSENYWIFKVRCVLHTNPSKTR